VDALRNRKIECRVYTKEKFHAKAYITHSKLTVVGSAALVGSSNFTQPGLTRNIELNIQIRREVEPRRDLRSPARKTVCRDQVWGGLKAVW
jgi:HKD family nuclease